MSVSRTLLYRDDIASSLVHAVQTALPYNHDSNETDRTTADNRPSPPSPSSTTTMATRKAGLSHDAFTYGAALEACGRTGNWQKAEDVVTQMADAYTASLAEVSQKGSGNDSDSGAAAGPSKSTLTPTTVHCNALLQSYSRGKRWVGRNARGRRCCCICRCLMLHPMDLRTAVVMLRRRRAEACKGLGVSELCVSGRCSRAFDGPI